MHVLCISISGSMYEENVIITPENVNVEKWMENEDERKNEIAFNDRNII